jgi:hypothetical protein
MRRFKLHRLHDVHGVSGEGIVAEGVEFENGGCTITWLSPYRTVAYYENIKALEKVHGHEGGTKVVWIDSEDHSDEVTSERINRIKGIAKKLGVTIKEEDTLDDILTGIELMT